MSRRKFIHAPDCAQVCDVAATADEDPVGYKKPSCTCLERQRDRMRLKALSATDAYSMFEGLASIGNGNYRHYKLSSEY